jgi:hypothetical protein
MLCTSYPLSSLKYFTQYEVSNPPLKPSTTVPPLLPPSPEGEYLKLFFIGIIILKSVEFFFAWG